MMHDCPDMDPERKRTKEGYLAPTCIPCWNRHINEKFHPDYIPKTFKDVWVDDNVSELIEQLDMSGVPKPYPQKECQFYDIDGHDIMLSAKCEVFHPASKDTALRVIKMLGDHYPQVAERCRILTKQKLKRTEWKQIPKSMMLGCSITTLSNKESKIVQPAASTPRQLIQMLRNAHKKGYKTWVVVEPFYEGMNLPQMLSFMPFLSEVWVGRLNYGRNIDLGGATLEALTKDDDEICVEYIEAVRMVKEKKSGMKVLPKREILKHLLSDKYADQIKLVVP
jgi:DNA repair photolyase